MTKDFKWCFCPTIPHHHLIYARSRKPTLGQCVWLWAVWNSAEWEFLGCFQPCTASPWWSAVPTPEARDWTGWRKDPGNSTSGGSPVHWAAQPDCCHLTGTSASWKKEMRWNYWHCTGRRGHTELHLISDFSIVAQVLLLWINGIVSNWTCSWSIHLMSSRWQQKHKCPAGHLRNLQTYQIIPAD